MPAACPPAARLLAFDRGTLPDPELEATADHLAECLACRDRLAAAAAAVADSLLRDLRLLHTPGVPAGPDFTRPSGPAPGVGPTAVARAGDVSTATRVGTGATPSDAYANAARPPGAFGRYHLQAVLGEGGMGVVYLAHDTVLKRAVAVKLLRGGPASAEERARFLAEAAAAARLRHPNVVQVHDLGEVEGQPYHALEYVPGGSLDRRVRDTLPDPRAAARVLARVARAVQAAHDLKIV